MAEKKKKEQSCCKRTSIGGQALIEGIMMRGPVKSAMAVRNPKNEIVMEEWETVKGGKRPAVFKIPIVRGMFNFIDSMKTGYRCLMRSAEIAMPEDEEPKKEKKVAEEAVVAEEAAAPAGAVPEGAVCTDAAVSEEAPSAEEKNKDDSKLVAVAAGIGGVLGVILCVALFVYLPSLLYDIVRGFTVGTPAEAIFGMDIIRSAFEGILRIILFVAYIGLMCLVKDVRRTFQYHGAEHKTIFCYEAGLPLTVENVKKQRRFHPRCGTSFMILMLIVSIVVGMFIPASLDSILRSAIKIALIPIIMGIGYELIRFCGKFDNLLTRIIAAPGMWLQRVTVHEPDEKMIECAIAAMEAVIPENTEKCDTAQAEKQ